MAPETQKATGAAPARVGFIGLGRMGYPMAGHIADAGLALDVFDTRKEVIEAFMAEHAATAARSPKDLAATCDAVVLMLPTSREVAQVLLGEGADGATGLADDLKPGSLVIDCSSSDPSETQRIGTILADRGLAMVDAPVAGGVVFAKEGALDVLIGGEDDAIERARPIITPFARSIVECGGLGSAHAMKVLNNFVNAQALITYAETMAIGMRFGIAPNVMIRSLTDATTGRNHPFEKKFLKQVVPGAFATGMALELISKDVSLARKLATDKGLDMPIVRQCAELWEQGKTDVGPAVDQTEIVRLWEAMADVSFVES